MLYLLSLSYLFRTGLIYAETVVYRKGPENSQAYETTIATALMVLFEFLPIAAIFYYHLTSSKSINKEEESDRASQVEAELMREQTNVSRTTGGGSRVTSGERGSKGGL